jgi:hypothetical protein
LRKLKLSKISKRISGIKINDISHRPEAFRNKETDESHFPVYLFCKENTN